MRKSCHEENRQMLQAYQLLQQGQHQQSIAAYESILSKTGSIEMKANLICTISVISSGVGNYNYALQILETNYQILEKTEALTRIRYLSNLCFLHIVTNHFSQSIQDMQAIKNTVQKTDKNPQIIRFLLSLFFRVTSLQQLDTNHSFQASKLSIMECFYLLNLAFAKEVCGFKGAEQILKKIFPVFISNKKMQFALICLRQLLLLPLQSTETIKYEKQFSKIVSMGFMENYQFDISDAIECCKLIAQEILNLCNSDNIAQQQFKEQDEINLWKTILKYQKRKLFINVSIAEEQRQVIFKNLQMMLCEKNLLVIKEMKKTDFYINSERQVESTLVSFLRVFHNRVHMAKSHSFCLIARQFKNKKSLKTSQILKEKKEDAENINPISPLKQQKREKSQQGKTKISKVSIIRSFSTHRLSNNLQENKSKKLAKMIRYCESGSFLSKRNYNSDGGEYRFVKVTNSVLKWGKNPQKIEEGCQIYPLKDIRSISYGKVTQTLMKSSNHLLKCELCFSLHLQKRTLDFYCKDFQQVQNWVIGLTHKLKGINPGIQGYTIGKMLWKKTFMRIRQKYEQNLPKHEKNYYYYPTAHAIILMGRQMK